MVARPESTTNLGRLDVGRHSDCVLPQTTGDVGDGGLPHAVVGLPSRDLIVGQRLVLEVRPGDHRMCECMARAYPPLAQGGSKSTAGKHEQCWSSLPDGHLLPTFLIDAFRYLNCFDVRVVG